MFDLVSIGERLRTQDNRITADPIFLVQQQRRVYGVDHHYTDDFEEIDGETVGYKTIWEFVTCCFTEAAADRYIAENAHNLTDPRTYVASAYRNREWIAVRAMLMTQPPAAHPSTHAESEEK